MLKKLLLLSISLLWVASMSAQQVPDSLRLHAGYFDPSEGLESGPRGPVDQLTVGLEGHTLYMSNVDFDVTLQLTDANNCVVYTTFVAANTYSVVLPSYLTGEYKIILIDDERFFWGYITL